ncbi:MAG: Uma2 family endonuclease [Bacteroidota bacterium]
MSEAIKILPHYTYSDYILWEGRWEVIGGIPYAMSPAPTPRHQRISVTLSSVFEIALKQCKKCKAYLPIDYMLSDDTILQPDLLVVCGEIKKKFLDFPPSLVLEILSPATALKDRHTKYSLYEKQGIKYYVIIDPNTDEAEIYLLKEKVFELQQKGGNFSFEFTFDDCTALVNFGEIW